MLLELGRGEYFTVSSVEAFLRKQLWSDHVNDLAKQGKISPDNRRLYKKTGGRTNSSPNVTSWMRENRMPNQAVPARALVEQLLKDWMIEVNARFSDCQKQVASQPT